MGSPRIRRDDREAMMMKSERCDLCGRWPRVPDVRWDGEYCAFHSRVMQWWADSYGTEYLRLEGRRFAAAWSRLRDRVRVWWIVETAYALRYGGPYDFWPWDRMARWICAAFGHCVEMIGRSNDRDEEGRLWFLFRCSRCGGRCSLPDGGANERAFAAEISYNTVYCGFTPIRRGAIR